MNYKVPPLSLCFESYAPVELGYSFLQSCAIEICVKSSELGAFFNTVGMPLVYLHLELSRRVKCLGLMNNVCHPPTLGEMRDASMDDRSGFYSISTEAEKCCI